eukprot:INCI16283.1.p1 GENE.INCI16283.1~~INCI16283.1.p1  ORF type:complete len:427 (-),score=81.37 INCI16283.1:237-1517(-)
MSQQVFEPLLHQAFPKAIDPALLQACMDEFVPKFKPMKVSYSNTNTYIKEAAEEAEQLADFADATEELSQGQQIEWRASSYMEVDEAMGGGMQKTIQPDLELLETCRPIIERCDEIFKQWYRSLHGQNSITDFKRLQTFVTRYRPRKHEDGLLRHIDGAQVDGSLILGLPSKFSGGGVTVWEGTRRVDEREWRYPMAPGDVCCLDNFVYHQGNPISSGERWAFVIFYRCKRLDGTRWGRVLKKFGAETQAARRAKVANSEQAAGGSAPEPTALADFARFVERVAGVDLSSNPKTTLQRLRLQAQALLVAHGDNSGAANVPPAAGETATVGASAPAAQAPSTQWTTAAIVAEVQKLATSLLREKGVGGEMSHSRLVIFVLRQVESVGLPKSLVKAPHIKQALANLVSQHLVERPTKERYIWRGEADS